MATLLEKAKKLKGKKILNVSKQDIELALAWVNDEVSLAQVMSVYELRGSAVYSKLAISIKAHLQNK